MYQPYLRGKQFELIGLRELCKPVLQNKLDLISPIIEPVRNSSTLKATLGELVNCGINFILIINPSVGDFYEQGGTDELFKIIGDILPNYKNFQCGLIFEDKTLHDSLLKLIEKNKALVPSLSIIHNCTSIKVKELTTAYQEVVGIKFNVINFGLTSRRYYKLFDKNTRVSLDDYFEAQLRSTDYLSIGESNFSEEHLFFKEDSFVGFSDYMLIGDSYSESGFMPYAVAIHLSYSDKDRNIKIKHFVSYSNEDTSNIAGKFAEALSKLIQWCDKTGYESTAVMKFRDFYQRQHFPGLGTIKKLSMMNHIELVVKLLS